MIYANSFAYFIEDKSILWLRIVFSFAAPLFIFLSGYSFFLSAEKKTLNKKYIQSLYLLGSAVFVDVFVWNILPFQTFDVLYIISIGILINSMMFSFNWYSKLVVSISAICITPILINKFDYRFSNEDFDLIDLGKNPFQIANIFNLKRLLVDGWFPVFPWIGIVIIGTIFASKANRIYDFLEKNKYFTLFIFSVSAYLVCINIVNAPRNEYMEIFYPANLLFLLMALLFIALIMIFSKKIDYNSKGIINLCSMGKNSLFVYILHLLIISICLKFITPSSFSIAFIISTIILLVAYYSTIYLESLRKRQKLNILPLGFRKLLGL